jgi:hypothetical protein
MTIEIIRERDIVVDEKFMVLYENEEKEYLFESDRDGLVDESLLTPEVLENLRQCREACKRGDLEWEVLGMTILDMTKSYVEPAVGRCVCGEEVMLSGFTNTCDCGRDYDSSGVLLAPRSQWGEETGEHPADIARIP